MGRRVRVHAGALPGAHPLDRVRCAEGVGKAAAIAGPYIFGALRDATGAVVWSLTFVAAVMASGGLATLFGRETRGQKLA